MLTKFLKDQSGAVTVDWVVMTAAVVGIGIATTVVVSGGVASTTGNHNLV
jgi:Flp pilus assembly pilin Flp